MKGVAMSAIVFQTDKRIGVTYAYESTSFWDKEKKQSRAKRKLIGKLDPETGLIVPTDARSQKAHQDDVSRSFCGATSMLDAIGDKIGLTDDLRRCFPESYQQILSIAYYLILEDKNPLSRFPKWAATHKHPFGREICSQRSSELFASITGQARRQFFKYQSRRRAESEFWAYDTTSISSYSQGLRQVKYGLNKEHDPLEQINLALLFGEKSALPFYYRKLAGNISDVKTVKNLLADLDVMGYQKVKLVMDRGFCSLENINALYQAHLKFVMSPKLNLRLIATEKEALMGSIRSWEYYHANHDLFAQSRTITWPYSQKRPYKGDVLSSERQMYFHLYFNAERAVEDERRFNRLLHILEAELKEGRHVQEHEKLYAKYFEIKSTPKRGIKISARQEAINEVIRNYGYFALISNTIKDPIEALEIYRNKDLAEKAFGDIKERLGGRRLAVSSELSLDGKLFVEFIALIFLSYIKKQMQDKGLFKTYTMMELLDELDSIELFQYPNRKPRLSEVTKKQMDILMAMDVQIPASLC
jgi:transposase